MGWKGNYRGDGRRTCNHRHGNWYCRNIGKFHILVDLQKSPFLQAVDAVVEENYAASNLESIQLNMEDVIENDVPQKQEKNQDDEGR